MAFARILTMVLTIILTYVSILTVTKIIIMMIQGRVDKYEYRCQ